MVNTKLYACKTLQIANTHKTTPNNSICFREVKNTSTPYLTLHTKSNGKSIKQNPVLTFKDLLEILSHAHFIKECGRLWGEGGGEEKAYLFITNAGKVFGCGWAHNVEDVVELVEVVLAGKDGPVGQHLCQNAPDWPYVNWDKTQRAQRHFKPHLL